jgi:hypothetical protein
LVKLLGGRAAAAAVGFVMLGLVSSEAGAQNVASLKTSAAVNMLNVDASAKPLGTAAALVKPAVATLANGTTVMTQPAQSVTVSIAPSIAREAAWLYQNRWPLAALAERYGIGAPLNEEANCIATAVYFEARGESAEGQLAVARVIMNRAASGQYPTSWCGVVKQPAQFSFVHHGYMPAPDYSSDSWRRAQGIARLAIANAIPSLSNDVLWYHANYVAPSWGRRLNMVQRIGAHIFYSS